jgi:capsular exopolysaccharide synthesis family protein
MSGRYHGTHIAQNGHKQPSARVLNESLAFEQLRVVATRLNQLGRERPLRVLAVTSSTASEGKTTISTNLAIIMARYFGRKTLLVDADFRRPGVATLLKSTFSHGLTELLRGEVAPMGARWQLLDQQLTVLPLIKPDPSAVPLLSHPAARARFEEAMEGFDTVIVDTPPALPLADNFLISDLVDGFIFVVKAEQTPRTLITSALKNIPRNKLVGFVLNSTSQFGHAAYNHLYYSSIHY